MTQIKLVDLNEHVVHEWKHFFSDKPEVEVIQGDITEQHVDVWVTPTNSRGHMSGGVDYAIKNKLGPEIEHRIQEAIAMLFGGLLPVGKAVIVPTGQENPRYVVATPSMVGESDNLKRTKNTALACAAAFQAIYYAADKHGEEINSIAIPGLGSGTGQVPAHVCAQLMEIGHKLFNRKRYENFDEMLTHLNQELGEAGYQGAANAGPQPNTGLVAQAVTADNGHPQDLHEKHDPVLTQQAEKEYAAEVFAKESGAEFKEAEHLKKDVGQSDYIKKMPIGTPII